MTENREKLYSHEERRDKKNSKQTEIQMQKSLMYNLPNA